MIKHALKYCIPVYLLVGGITIALTLGRRDEFLPALAAVLFLITIVVVAGLLIGMIISVLIKKPNYKRKVYLLGQLISFTLLVGAMVYMRISNSQGSKHLNAYHWYTSTKSIILSDSNAYTDSTSLEKYPDGKTHKIWSYNHGHPTVEKWYREAGEEAAETNFSHDGLFELRKEICKDGNPLFEGIFYKDHAYGPSTWWRCDSTIDEQGIRFNDREIGVWQYWDSSGKVEKINYHREELIDSLPMIMGVDD